jgi:hypothetical protein
MSESEVKSIVARIAAGVQKHGLPSLAVELPRLRDRHMRTAVRHALGGRSGRELVCMCDANLIALPALRSHTLRHEWRANELRRRFARSLAMIVDPKWDPAAEAPLARRA